VAKPAKTAGVLDLLKKNPWEKLMDFFLGCFLNIWKKQRWSRQCSGEQIEQKYPASTVAGTVPSQP